MDPGDQAAPGPGHEYCPGLVAVERPAFAEGIHPAGVRGAGVQHGTGDQAYVGVRVVGVLRGDDVRTEEGHLVGVGGGDPFDATPDPLAQGFVGFGARDDVPPAGLEHRQCDRVLIDHPSPELAALPVAEKHLAQVGLDEWLDAEPPGQRLGRLTSAPQCGDVDRGDPLAGAVAPTRRRLRRSRSGG